MYDTLWIVDRRWCSLYPQNKSRITKRYFFKIIFNSFQIEQNFSESTDFFTLHVRGTKWTHSDSFFKTKAYVGGHNFCWHFLWQFWGLQVLSNICLWKVVTDRNDDFNSVSFFTHALSLHCAIHFLNTRNLWLSWVRYNDIDLLFKYKQSTVVYLQENFNTI